MTLAKFSTHCSKFHIPDSRHLFVFRRSQASINSPCLVVHGFAELISGVRLGHLHESHPPFNYIRSTIMRAQPMPLFKRFRLFLCLLSMIGALTSFTILDNRNLESDAADSISWLRFYKISRWRTYHADGCEESETTQTIVYTDKYSPGLLYSLSPALLPRKFLLQNKTKNKKSIRNQKMTGTVFFIRICSPTFRLLITSPRRSFHKQDNGDSPRP
jgi:hypothetical protein